MLGCRLVFRVCCLDNLTHLDWDHLEEFNFIITSESFSNQWFDILLVGDVEQYGSVVNYELA